MAGALLSVWRLAITCSTSMGHIRNNGDDKTVCKIDILYAKVYILYCVSVSVVEYKFESRWATEQSVGFIDVGTFAFGRGGICDDFIGMPHVRACLST